MKVDKETQKKKKKKGITICQVASKCSETETHRERDRETARDGATNARARQKLMF